MGCGTSAPEAQPPRHVQWPKPPQYDLAGLRREDFVAREHTGPMVRAPGTVCGQNLEISNARGAECPVVVLDHSEQVSVSNCVDTVIVIAACESSVFLRDCRNCTVMVCCHQLRMRGCRNCRMLLQCDAQPAVEASSVQLGCAGTLLGFFDHQRLAGYARLSGVRNRWWDPHKFGPDGRWQFLSWADHQAAAGDIAAAAAAAGPEASALVNTDQTLSPFPLVVGPRREAGDSLIAAVYADGVVQDSAFLLCGPDDLPALQDLLLSSPSSVEEAAAGAAGADRPLPDIVVARGDSVVLDGSIVAELARLVGDDHATARLLQLEGDPKRAMAAATRRPERFRQTEVTGCLVLATSEAGQRVLHGAGAPLVAVAGEAAAALDEAWAKWASGQILN